MRKKLGKKIFTCFMVLVLITQPFGNMFVKASSSPEQEQDITIGDGTSENPYQIWNVSQLQKITVKGLNKNYILMSDIIFDSQDNWTSIGTSTAPFKGTFNGNDFMIKNLTVSSYSDNIGLFGYINTATIKNLSIEKVSVQGNDNVGGLIGYANGTCNIENCSSIGTVKGNNNVGGLIGYWNNGSPGNIKRCYFEGAVNGLNRVGGLIGLISKGNVLYCYNKSNVIGTGIVGGLLGEALRDVSINESFNLGVVKGASAGGLAGSVKTNSSISDCYNRGEVIAISGNAGGIASNESYSVINRCYSTGNITGGAAAGISISGSGSIKNCVAMSRNINAKSLAARIFINECSSNNNASYEDMVVKASYIKKEIKSVHNGADGMNISEDRITSNSEYLESISWNFNTIWMIPSGGKDFPILKNINSKVQKPVYPLGTKENPYLIYNENDLKKITSLGLDRYYKLMKDIEILNENWTPIGTQAEPFIGVFDGNNYNIKNLKTLDSVDYKGLFGIIKGATVINLQLKNCDIQGNDNVGSIAGYAYGTCNIENCSSIGTVKGNNNVGGLIGYWDKGSSGIVKRCCFEGAVNGLNRVGGLVGKASGSHILQCYNTSTVTGNTYVGGLTGELADNGSIKESFNLGNVLATFGSKSANAGGIAGMASRSTISDCYNQGEIISNGGVGGIVSFSPGQGGVSIDRCYSSGDLVGTVVGGILTNAGNPIRNCVVMSQNLTNTQFLDMFIGRILADYGGWGYSSQINNYVYEGMVVRGKGSIVNVNLKNVGYNGTNVSMAALTDNSSHYESMTWDFKNIWMMPGNDDSLGYPILRNIQVKPEVPINPNVPVTGINVDPTSKVMHVGKKLPLVETVSPNNATNKNVTWSSSDSSVATVDQNGLVTAVSVGKVTITVQTDDGTYTATCEMTVVDTKILNDTDAGISYSDNWVYHNNDPDFYNNDQHYTKKKDASAGFTFNGTCVSIIGATSWNLGIMDVYLDGVKVKTVDLYSENLETQKVLFKIEDLSAGWHTIKIVCTGNKNENSTDTNITLDAIRYDECKEKFKSTNIINDSDSRINYSANWTPWQNDSTFFMGDQHFTNVTGAYAELTFVGTRINVIAATSLNLGKMDVYLDEVLVDTVDLYSENLEAQKIVFSKSGLTDDHHTIKIVCKGEKNINSSDYHITLDAFEYD